MSYTWKCALACGMILSLALPGRSLDSHPASTPTTASIQNLEARGNSIYGKGRTLIYTGAAILPLGLLALVPVMYDGAFGITAADGGIGGFILGAGVALIEVGIPITGIGADKLDAAASGNIQGYKPDDPGWKHFQQGWRWIGYGGMLLVSAVPFAIIGGLDYTDAMPWFDYTALALGTSGLCLGAAGIVRHGQSLIHFTGRRNRAHRALSSAPKLSLQPLFRRDRQGTTTAGLRLSAGF